MKHLAAAALLLACAACATTAPESAGRPTRENFARVVANKITASEVRDLLGRPTRVLTMHAGQGEAWGYRYTGGFEWRMFWVEVSADGTVRATSDTPDFEAGRYRGP